MTDLARHAIAFAERLGFAVFPVGRDCRSPLIEKGCHAASNDPAVVAEMWRTRPDANIAIALGAVSGALVLDIDNKENQPGFKSLARLQGDYGQLPDSWISETPSLGRHLWFAQPEALPLRNRVNLFVEHADRTRTTYAGIDVRTTAGSACAPPSAKPSGPYRWIVPPSALPLAPAPAWLCRIIDPPPPPLPPRKPLKVNAADRVARYVAAAVDSECRGIATMKANTGRNQALFQAAANLGGFVANHYLRETDVESALERAAQECGLTAEDGYRAVRATISSGIKAGLSKPRGVDL